MTNKPASASDDTTHDDQKRAVGQKENNPFSEQEKHGEHSQRRGPHTEQEKKGASVQPHSSEQTVNQREEREKSAWQPRSRHR
jgi:hypothetical protein